MSHEEMFRSSLLLTTAQIEGGPWEGVGISQRAALVGEISESNFHRGYYHCRAIGREDSFETKRPIIARAVGIAMEALLGNYGKKCSDLKWKALDNPPFLPQERIYARSSEIVYFLRAGPFIKIGKATGRVNDRISSFKTGCPYPIDVLGTIPGGFKEEHALHEKFASIRAHGEWFHATDELVEFINSIEVAA